MQQIVQGFRKRLMLRGILNTVTKLGLLKLENKISAQDGLRNVTDLRVAAVTEQAFKSILAQLVFEFDRRLCLIFPLSLSQNHPTPKPTIKESDKALNEMVENPVEVAGGGRSTLNRDAVLRALTLFAGELKTREVVRLCVDLEPLVAEFEEASGKASSKSCKC